jgi:hypothetical protein
LVAGSDPAFSPREEGPFQPQQCFATFFSHPISYPNAEALIAAALHCRGKLIDKAMGIAEESKALLQHEVKYQVPSMLEIRLL